MTPQRSLVLDLAVSCHRQEARDQVQSIESAPISRLVIRRRRIANSRKSVLAASPADSRVPQVARQHLVLVLHVPQQPLFGGRGQLERLLILIRCDETMQGAQFREEMIMLLEMRRAARKPCM